MSLTTPALGRIVRLSVSAGDQRLDLSAPSTIPVAELLPGIVAQLHQLSASSAHGGYRLVFADGTAIDPGRTLGEQHISDGAMLTLESGLVRAEPRVYDDLVEAVADAVGSARPWSTTDSATTAVGAAIAFLMAGAIVLTGAQGSWAIPLAAAITAILVATTALVLSRFDNPAAGVLAAAGAIFGAIAGYTMPADRPWQLALAGIGAIVLAVVQLPLLPRVELMVPIVCGSALAIVGSMLALTDLSLGAIASVVAALAVAAGNTVPWLAIANTRLRVITPLAESDIYAEPPLADPAVVAAKVARGQRFRLALAAAVALIALVATPAIVATGGWGLALAATMFTAMVTGIRSSYARSSVLLALIAGVLGLVETLVVAAIEHPQWVGALSASAAALAAVIIAGALVPKPRLRWARIADAVELTSLALLLPLGLLAAGL